MQKQPPEPCSWLHPTVPQYFEYGCVPRLALFDPAPSLLHCSYARLSIGLIAFSNLINRTLVEFRSLTNPEETFKLSLLKSMPYAEVCCAQSSAIETVVVDLLA